MDKTKAVLEEMNLKASNSTDVYDLIMNLMKELPLHKHYLHNNKITDPCKFKQGNREPGRC